MKNLTITIGNCVIIMTLFLIMTGCTHEQMVRKSNCVPPPFPTTQALDPIEERYRRVDVDKSVQEISEYYFDLLLPIDAKGPDGWVYDVWRVQEWSDYSTSIMLFDCSGSIDRLTKETGCIFLHIKEAEVTTIEYMWNLGDVVPGCSPQLEQ